MTKTSIIPAILFLITIFAVPSFAGNYADTYGFSAEGIARGNAMTAIVNNWSSVFYNISGLGKTKGDNYKRMDTSEGDMTIINLRDRAKEDRSYNDELAITYMLTYPMMDIDISRSDQYGNPLETRGDQNLQFGAVIFGIVIDLNHIYRMPEFISSARLGFSAGMLHDGHLTKVNDIDLRTHNFIRYGRETQRSVIFSGIGLGFLDDLFGIGFGMTMMFSGQGSAQVSDLDLGDEEQTAHIQTKMNVKSQRVPVAGIYFSAGKLSKSIRGLDFGFTYRGESFMEMYPYRTAAKTNVGYGSDMVFGIVEFYTPHIFIFGTAYSRLVPGLTISLDVEYQKWSGFKISKSREQYLIEEWAERPPALRDIFSYKLGFSYELTGWCSLLAGYYYEPSVVPDSQTHGRFNLLDNDKHAFSIGSKFIISRRGGMGGPVHINIGIQLQYMPERNISKDTAYASSYNPDYSYGGYNPTAVTEVIFHW